MISMDKKYTTRDGREVVILATGLHGSLSVVAKVKKTGGWVPVLYHENGEYFFASENMYDLIEVKPKFKHEVWINVYPDINGTFVGCMTYNDESTARTMISGGEKPVKTVKVTIEGEY